MFSGSRLIPDNSLLISTMSNRVRGLIYCLLSRLISGRDVTVLIYYPPPIEVDKSGGVDKSGVLGGVDKSDKWPGLRCSRTYLLSVVSVDLGWRRHGTYLLPPQLK